MTSCRSALALGHLLALPARLPLLICHLTADKLLCLSGNTREQLELVDAWVHEHSLAAVLLSIAATTPNIACTNIGTFARGKLFVYGQGKSLGT